MAVDLRRRQTWAFVDPPDPGRRAAPGELTVSAALPLWPRTRMRVLSLTLDGAVPLVRELARVDVTTDPVLGCRTERLMTACYDPLATRLGPFEGERLTHAIWKPQAADILVAASVETILTIPAGVTRLLPWILVLRAWCRLVAVAPSSLLDLCWHRGGGCFSDAPWEVSGTAELSAALLARMLLVMLHQASPEELVAYSKGAL